MWGRRVRGSSWGFSVPDPTWLHVEFFWREEIIWRERKINWREHKNVLAGTQKNYGGKDFSRRLCAKLNLFFFQFRAGAVSDSFVSQRERSFNTIFAY